MKLHKRYLLKDIFALSGTKFRLLTFLTIAATAFPACQSGPGVEAPSEATTATTESEPESESESIAEAETKTEEQTITAAECDLERDRQAILAMQGTYAVTFFFQEVEALAPDYSIVEEPYESAGIEVIEAIFESEEKIVLQHILMIPEGGGEYFPLKHWRQDWTYQDIAVLEYVGERIWEHRELTAAEYECAWTQSVSQVDDSPRYEAYGSWVHEDETSWWQSSQTYRPLPRRESARADEYDVLLVTNTHSIDDQGWDHIEDNLKWRLSDNSALVREEGLNRYERIDAPDATRQPRNT